MAKCKLRIRRLTMALGALRWSQSEEDDEEIDEEAERILTNKHLHRAVEISIKSSLAQKTRPHIHGIDDRLTDQFWASGNDSDSGLEWVVEEERKPNSKVRVVDCFSKARFCRIQGTAQRGNQVIKTVSRAPAATSCLWEGPLPPPRCWVDLSAGVRLETESPAPLPLAP
jgi:hypothetical protein